MRCEFKATSQLNDADRLALQGLSAAVYPPRPVKIDSGGPEAWARPDWHFLVWLADNRLAAYVGALARSCLCDGQKALIGGIGGVKTHPARRGKGYASAAIRLAIDYLERETRADFSLLVCREGLLGFYERFGFQHFRGDTFARQRGKRSLFTWNEVMTKPARAPDCQVLDLCGLPW